MADEGYGEDDAFFFDDDDYLYVEDDYAIAVSSPIPLSNTSTHPPSPDPKQHPLPGALGKPHVARIRLSPHVAQEESCTSRRQKNSARKKADFILS
jgi:hypothetical protein